MYSPIFPPQCLGIMGGGQLGRMLAISAKQMGYKVAILEPNSHCPAYQFADYPIIAKYDDQLALNELGKLAAVVTTEFENVPAASMEYLSQLTRVCPNVKAITTSQSRLTEKRFFNQLGIKTTQYCKIDNLNDIIKVNCQIFPAILKTNNLGYDGKGQIKVTTIENLKQAFLALNQVPCILEKVVELKLEVSLIVASNEYETVTYPIVENRHCNGILDLTLAPAQIEESLKQEIYQAGLKIIKELQYIGILAIEFFITTNNHILANEMAPRPHNSGHYTLNANLTSQFEQQIRSICNLRLGTTTLHSNAIMLNLLGDMWQNETTPPNFTSTLGKYNNVKLHLYEKQLAKPGRKMGHLTILGTNLKQLEQEIKQIKLSLNNN